MASYRVRFINEIARNHKLFRCCQRVIVIRSARSRERAIEAAKKRFARAEGIRDWKIHAGSIEVETKDPGLIKENPGSGGDIQPQERA
jgi:hypothetical protein